MKTLFLAFLLLCSLPAWAAGENAAYDRVMKSQTIRCGYGTSMPWVYRDLRSGTMKGLYIDLMNAVAHELQLKLEWPEETGWGNIPASLEAGRIDAACSLLWVDPMRARQVAYTRPLLYSPIYVFARTGETRFARIDDINRPDVRVAVIDGDMSASLAAQFFPRAVRVSLPSGASNAEMFLTVTGGKADVTFMDPVTIENFNAAQDKKLVRVSLPKPLIVYGTALAVGIREQALKEMLDATVSHMINAGKIEAIARDFIKAHPGAVILPKGEFE